ncbi:hypothetical protein M1M11_09040 [Pseudomonas azerbaijanoccidens]|uniref:hypothetical protein n=1 Tax=Pseudomonas azerbaijanoccidentalis TaxID=2842347 RepID=UPI00200B7B46|nr:hypothetical protein [Pseudomonas azerbaijanoccidentalis]MCK8665026.1 hypothetical protein [Pseudomonas azerbaijanoccidentalis]
MPIAERITCGSEPARDSGGSVIRIAVCVAAIASRLAPTGITGILLFVIVLLLSACASQPPLPEQTPSLSLPLQLHIQRLQAEQRQDWVLVIQQEGPALRWSMIDLLGIPQARQKLLGNDWQADGLLPPNPEARELFAALLFALTPENELSGNYPNAWQHGSQRSLPERWDVRYSQPLSFELRLSKGPTYQITPLSGDTP